MSEFKIGDKVEVIDVCGVVTHVQVGDIVTVETVVGDYLFYVTVDGKRSGMYASRFKSLKGTLPAGGDTSDNKGGSTGYYDLPPDAACLQDLIEFQNMNFAVGNIFKAAYRLGGNHHSDAVRDLNKIIWFAQREINRIKASGAEVSATETT